MKTICKPEKSIDVFIQCANSIKENDKKTRLIGCKDIVNSYVLQYCESKTSDLIHTISTHSEIKGVNGIVSKKEMQWLYKNTLLNKSKAELREYYDKILASAYHGKCCYCGENDAVSVDHYLPKSKYPVFAVILINLLPTCSDCNSKQKKDHEINSENEALFHPYYDEWDEEEWLVASVTTDDKRDLSNLLFKYDVVKPENWSDLLYERVKFHFDKFKLGLLYSKKAKEHLNDTGFLYEKLNEAGKLNSTLQNEIDKKDHKNSYLSAMYRALIDFEI